VGDRVEAGQPLLTIYHRGGASAGLINESITLSETPLETPKWLLDTIE
jgi:hypothetical protein